jgi:hypothetical protein
VIILDLSFSKKGLKYCMTSVVNKFERISRGRRFHGVHLPERHVERARVHLSMVEGNANQGDDRHIARSSAITDFDKTWLLVA